MAAPTRRFLVLLAEDDDDDVLMVRDALGAAGINHDLRHVGNGEELLDYLNRREGYAGPGQAPTPDLVLLDLNMPGKDGRDSLREIRADSRLRRLPVVVLSTSSDSIDVDQSYDLGANSYLVKPYDYASWVALMGAVAHYWFDRAELPHL
ncbi:MAG: response regulator [Alphaproteobacteria bacterium]|jgi:CheY-like chemotaxis protein|nr:response regulator [Alphaproteobacteria bacterium]MDP6515343.1 response regulator [Alphaproteobacteria bacterium]